MNIHVQTIGFNLNKELQEFVTMKSEKLVRRCTDLLKIEVAMKLVGTFNKESKRCEIRLVIPGNDLIGSYTGRTFEEAVLMSVEILERRLQERKNKRVDYRLASL